MLTNIEIAKKYFEVSNQSDFDAIGKLFTHSTTYSSQNTGLYLGVEDILAMQRSYHGSFQSLNWKINDIQEVKSGIIEIDFSFSGVTIDGDKVSYSGLEYVVICGNLIQHIEVRNKK